MRKFKTVVYPQVNKDSDDVRWEAPNGTNQGFGYKSREDGLIHVIKCPACHKENYLAQTVCVWCQFDPNPTPGLRADVIIFDEAEEIHD